MGWDSRELLNRAMWPLSLCYSRGYQHLVVHVWSPMAATRAEGREGGSSAERGAPKGWHPQQTAARGRCTGRDEAEAMVTGTGGM